MRVLVTGVSGQVGSAITARAGFSGDIIPATRQVLDLSRPREMGGLLDALQPDLIVNAAAYTAVDRAEEECELAFRINADAVAKLGRWACEKGVPVIHFSTDYVFDGRGDHPFSEDGTVNPLSVYGKSKAEGERLLRVAGPAHLVIRTSWVYAAQGKNFLRTIARLAQEREHLRVVANQFGAPTSANQIADCVASILRRRPHDFRDLFAKADNMVHFTASGVTSWHGFASAIVDGLKRRGVALRTRTVEPIPSSEYPATAVRPANSRLGTSRIQKVFGIYATPWREALDRELDLLAKEISA
jgi:dTDP-4-dehydrorhamnose reductase